MPIRMNLPHGETGSHKTYSMPDPDELSEGYTDAYRAHYYSTTELGTHGTLSEKQISTLLTLASGYLDLTMYELGQECCVEKLRDIWRARRARAAAEAEAEDA